MQELKTDELKQIDGGFGFGITGLAIGSIGIPFIIGIISGYFETVPCK